MKRGVMRSGDCHHTQDASNLTIIGSKASTFLRILNIRSSRQISYQCTSKILVFWGTKGGAALMLQNPKFALAIKLPLLLSSGRSLIQRRSPICFFVYPFIFMGQQHNKTIKRRRRRDYLKRCKERTMAAAPAKAEKSLAKKTVQKAAKKTVKKAAKKAASKSPAKKSAKKAAAAKAETTPKSDAGKSS